jgi:hypothetical protein
MSPVLSFALLAMAQPAIRSDACEARILGYADWREAPDQVWDFAWPAGDGADLAIVGVEHVRDPGHAQFARMSAALRQSGRRVAFFEGPDRGVGADLGDTVRRFGESGAVRFLARAQGLETRSLEPDPAAQVRALLADYPPDQVMLFFVLRQAAQLRDRDGVRDAALDRTMAALLVRVRPLAEAAGMAAPIADLTALQAAVDRYWPGRSWRDFPGDWFSPLADDAQTGGLFLARINRADSENRNRHMFRTIAASVRAGERPFVAVGRNHVPMLAPALVCALGQDDRPAR